MSKKIIFGTGTPRSGGALLSNILSVHNDISITTDLVHFFRHIYKKYCPISKSSNQSKLVYELCVRIKYRQQIILSPEEMLSHFDKVENYSDVIAAISDFFLRKNMNKKIFGEYENGEWRNIKNFLELDKNYKSFQVIRDPRAILTSWKKMIPRTPPPCSSSNANGGITDCKIHAPPSKKKQKTCELCHVDAHDIVAKSMHLSCRCT